MLSNLRLYSSSFSLIPRSARFSSGQLQLGRSNNAVADQFTENQRVINLTTVTKEELETLVQAWGHPKYRGNQVYQWVRKQGVTDIDQMTNLPKTLRSQLADYTRPTSLEIATEQRSKKDGTIKRAYRLHDGQIIESVLMPYRNGRFTACISSQAGCAQGCVFCATGQMGLKRQLTADEIFEQVARFAQELASQKPGEGVVDPTVEDHGRPTRLSNVVFMGMGEPLANYRNVVEAVNRITKDLGISARKITVSTVGIVPNIRKLAQDPNMPPVRLAVSLHCATDEERDALLPVNRRYGGLHELMTALREYMDKSGERRISLEWALINGENDDPTTATQLAKLIRRYLRHDLVHVNVIPLNPTKGYNGKRSQRERVNQFVETLKSFKIACTPRVRRGIDIDAGCGQLTVKVQEKEAKMQQSIAVEPTLDDALTETLSLFEVENEAINVDEDDRGILEDVFAPDELESARLIDLVKGSTFNLEDLNK